jgi:hypothetical protein
VAKGIFTEQMIFTRVIEPPVKECMAACRHHNWTGGCASLAGESVTRATLVRSAKPQKLRRLGLADDFKSQERLHQLSTLS